jgi:hypothetical protein
MVAGGSPAVATGFAAVEPPLPARGLTEPSELVFSAAEINAHHGDYQNEHDCWPRKFRHRSSPFA